MRKKHEKQKLLPLTSDVIKFQQFETVEAMYEIARKKEVKKT